MLTTAALHDGDLDRAIGELMANATRLAVTGHRKEAREALELLVQAAVATASALRASTRWPRRVP